MCNGERFNQRFSHLFYVIFLFYVILGTKTNLSRIWIQASHDHVCYNRIQINSFAQHKKSDKPSARRLSQHKMVIMYEPYYPSYSNLSALFG